MDYSEAIALTQGHLIDIMDIYGPNGMQKDPQKTYLTKKMDYIKGIALIRGATCQKYKFLSEICFGMIF